VRVKALSQVGMTVKSLKTSIDFYWGHFRLPVVEIMEGPSGVIRELYGHQDTTVKIALLRCGWGSFIELFEFVPPHTPREAARNHPGFTHLTLDVGNVDRAYRQLTAKGVKFLGGPVHEKGAHFVFLKDPDGNLVELIDMGTLYYLNKFFGRFVGWFYMATRFRNRDGI
jgi:catechol 2,3-dioxygenase-like lactoylglutathione lyase family enzyme